tara:strand:+ start:255 stop:884 length:630 start_codon:yes stop_codon:yes gene_type:complete
MAKKNQTKRGHWKARRNSDHFANEASLVGYRSRAAWKLLEINEKDRLINRNGVTIDLGAAPGSWSQVVSKQTEDEGIVVAVDVLQMQPLPSVTFIKGNFLQTNIQTNILKAVNYREVDLVLSDMAPNLTGVRDTDQMRSIELARAARDFALGCLGPKGCLLVKLFDGTETVNFQQETKRLFRRCLVRKPNASRSESTEFFLIARYPRYA